MDTTSKPNPSDRPARIAEAFTQRIIAGRVSALEELRMELGDMDEWQIRECAEHLCEQLTEEDNSAEVLKAVFAVLESLEVDSATP